MWKDTKDCREGQPRGMAVAAGCAPQRSAQEAQEGWRKAKLIPLQRGKGSSGNYKADTG